jgi:glycosyltransferase involved in cell wall biosynthesis
MNILFDNINLASNSGPNGFALKLLNELSQKDDINILTTVSSSDKFDVQLSFILANCNVAPIVQRLDGIYFNSEQDFKRLNTPIYETYKLANSVIFQSEFNKQLTESYFGKHDDSYVVHNGTSKNVISMIEPLKIPQLNSYDEVWSCASSWRPHKRLKDNIQYFLDFAPKNSCLVIAGENPDVQIANPRIFYAGQLTWIDLVGLFKISATFLHLAWLDHCPNVVIDARASGCSIVCSSAGGTSEIAGKNAKIVIEDEWDFTPTKLYRPPQMDFSKIKINEIDNMIDISSVAKKYEEIFRRFL